MVKTKSAPQSATEHSVQCTPVRKTGEKFKPVSSPIGKPDAKGAKRDTDDVEISDSELNSLHYPGNSPQEHNALLRSFEGLLDSKMSQMKSDIVQSISAEIGVMRASLTAHESRMSDMDTRISSLESSIAGLAPMEHLPSSWQLLLNSQKELIESLNNWKRTRQD